MYRDKMMEDFENFINDEKCIDIDKFETFIYDNCSCSSNRNIKKFYNLARKKLKKDFKISDKMKVWIKMR